METFLAYGFAASLASAIYCGRKWYFWRESFKLAVKDRDRYELLMGDAVLKCAAAQTQRNTSMRELEAVRSLYDAACLQIDSLSEIKRDYDALMEKIRLQALKPASIPETRKIVRAGGYADIRKAVERQNRIDSELDEARERDTAHVED